MFLNMLEGKRLITVSPVAVVVKTERIARLVFSFDPAPSGKFIANYRGDSFSSGSDTE